MNQNLVSELETIFKNDQHGRKMIDSMQNKFGLESSELLQLMEEISLMDSINLQKVIAIISTHGWPGKNLVGDRGNQTVFLVIQHSDLDIQKKYLPLLKESVAKGESKSSHLAYLEDRILVRDGRSQRYGTQLEVDDATGNWKLYQIEDEENVDVRRAAIGLMPLRDYVKQFGIDYNKGK